MNQILYSGKVNKKPIFILIAVVLVIVIVIFSVGFGIANLSNDKILNGVVIANVDVSNMTKEEAIQAVNSVYAESTARTIILNYGDFSFEISSDDIGFGYTNAEELVEQGYEYGRNGNIFQNNITVLKSYMNTENRIQTEEKIDFDKLKMAVEDAIPEENIFVKDDYYEVSGDKLLFTKGVEGKKIDYTTLGDKVLEALKTREMNVEIPVVISTPVSLDIDEVYAKVHKEPVDASYKEGATFEVINEVNGLDFDKEEAKSLYIALKPGETAKVDLKVTEPKIKVADLGDVLFKTLIATYTSKYDTSDKNRVTNLEVAANRCNNTVLYPGDEFSYNKALGHRTTANGYKMGNSFSGGKVVQTIGGGICQVSSTLYNAVLRADLTITDRTAHGMYVQYVPQSTDATVVDNAIDFKFRNDRKYPVKIVTTCENGVMTASIYGVKEADEPTIDIETKILETLEYTTQKQNDSSMKKGATKVVQKPVNGYVSEAYKVYYKNGKETSRELISKDKYIPTNEIIKVGTKVDKPAGEVVTPPVVDPEKPTDPLLPPGWDNPESGY